MTSKILVMVIVSVFAPFLQVQLFPEGLFSALDLLGGLLGNIVYTTTIIFLNFKQLDEGTGGKPMTKRKVWLYIFQIFGAGITSFFLLSLIRSGGGDIWLFNVDVSDPYKSWRVSGAFGFLYALIMTPGFLKVLGEKAQQVVNVFRK